MRTRAYLVGIESQQLLRRNGVLLWTVNSQWSRRLVLKIDDNLKGKPCLYLGIAQIYLGIAQSMTNTLA